MDIKTERLKELPRTVSVVAGRVWEKNSLEIMEVFCLSCVMVGISVLLSVWHMLIIGGVVGALCFERASTLRDRERRNAQARANAQTYVERIP